MGTLYSLYDKAGGRVLDLGKWGAALAWDGLRLGGEVTDGRLALLVVEFEEADRELLAAVRVWVRLSAGPVTYWADDHDEPWRDDRTQEPLHGLRLWALTGPGGRGDGGDWRPCRDWGFHTAAGWVPARVYLDQYDQAGATQNAARVAYDAAQVAHHADQDPPAADSPCSHAWQNFGYATQRCCLCEARRPQPGFECRVCGGIPEHFEPCHTSICNACARSETL